MNYPAEGMFQLVKGSLRSQFNRRAFTESRKPPCFNWKQKERSRMEQKAFDLCGIATMGDIFSCVGGLSFMLFHRTSFAWPAFIFSTLSSAKWANALGERDNWWGPCATASHISFFDHGLPVFVGHPSWYNSASRSPAWWAMAIPAGHISLR